jgi:phospho-N-acetylmuramoyl-pentapeptide-transferase
LYPLREIFFGFNVFKYITFRAMFASITAFLVSLILGRFVIRKLAQMRIGENIKTREYPSLYELQCNKQGTPTMGGILIVISIVVSTVLWADITNKYILLALFTTVWLGAVGFLDDYIKLRKAESRGLSVTTKFTGQMILGFIIGMFLFFDGLSYPQAGRIDVPFLKHLVVDIGYFYIFFVMMVIVGASNAVNLTDGLDGLASGCVIMVAVAYAGLSYVSGHIKFSDYLQILYVPNSGELAVFCASIVGAGLGFLWYNAPPAAVFMGDTGSLALGGALGVVAVFIKKELLLFLVGGVFVVEAFSVILQVASYKARGKRIFLMAPIHHHFQLKGWPESKITVRFWILAAVLALLSLGTLKLR